MQRKDGSMPRRCERVRIPPDLIELIEFFEGLKGVSDGGQQFTS
jgi:hypothetical protein